MKKFECRFYVANNLKLVKVFEGNSYKEVFDKAHEYSHKIIKKPFVQIACHKL